jgi:hypothetical protein
VPKKRLSAEQVVVRGFPTESARAYHGEIGWEATAYRTTMARSSRFRPGQCQHRAYSDRRDDQFGDTLVSFWPTSGHVRRSISNLSPQTMTCTGSASTRLGTVGRGIISRTRFELA